MGNLSITEDYFNALYPDLIGMYSHFNNPVPKGISKEDFEQFYLSSKLWRLNNIYTIVNKKGKAIIFRMNSAQHIVYARTRLHPRIIILKSRQRGISTFWLVSFFDDGVFGEYLQIGLMAQGNDEAIALLARVKFLWEKLDLDIKAFLNVKLTKDNTKEYGFSNNSTMFIRVSFRSAVLQRLHISEFGKIANANPNRAKETKTGTLQALGQGNTGVIESTAEGRNAFKDMWDKAVIAQCSGELSVKDFYPIFLSWLDDPDCNIEVHQHVDVKTTEYFEELEEQIGYKLTRTQKNFWVVQYRELEGDIMQEYPATPEEAFTASRDGTYYSKKFSTHCVRKGGVMHDLYDPNLDTDIYFDLGVDDYMVLIWVQWYRGKYRIVAEYHNNGYDLEWYIDEVIIPKGWPIRTFEFPHDIRARQLVSGQAEGRRARSRFDIIVAYTKEKAKYEKVLARTKCAIIEKSAIADGIEAVRRVISDLLIDIKCTYIIDCLHNYSKEWDPKREVWKQTPLHDEFSHGADCLRQIAVGHSEKGESSKASNRSKQNTGHAV